VIPDVAETSARVYRLAADVRHALFDFAKQHESERAAMEISLVGPPLPFGKLAISEEFRQALAGMLHRDREKRIATATEVAKALEGTPEWLPTAAGGSPPDR